MRGSVGIPYALEFHAALDPGRDTSNLVSELRGIDCFLAYVVVILQRTFLFFPRVCNVS